MNATEKQITKRVEEAIADEVFPGCVIGFITPQDREVLPFGYHTYEKEAPVQKGTIYDIASVTKAIAPHCVLLKLIDDGRANLSDSVVEYLPSFDTSQKKQAVTLEHLLTYTVNLKVPKTSDILDMSVSDGLQKLLSAPLRMPAGKEYLYSNTTAILISLVAKSITGKRLDKTGQNFFFNSLEMSKTTFHPDKLPHKNIVPTENKDRLDRAVHGEVHDESTHILQQEGKYLGAAGLFSTAPDLLKFLRMLIDNGVANERQYFSKEMMKDMFSVHFSGPEYTMGLGWEVNASRYMGNAATVNSFGVPGFTGCSLVGDTERNAGVVLLSNRIFPQRPGHSDQINNVRRDIADIVWQSVDKK